MTANKYPVSAIKANFALFHVDYRFFPVPIFQMKNDGDPIIISISLKEGID